MISKIYNNILNGYNITVEDTKILLNTNLYELVAYADKLREFFCDNKFDVCSIINAKSGRCGEDCKFCAQSIHYNTGIAEYDLLDDDKIINQAYINKQKGVLRFSIVASGKRLSNSEIKKVCNLIKCIKKDTGLFMCCSVGLLHKEQLQDLKYAGIDMVHNNLESSESYFSKICSTHTFQDKVSFIKLCHSMEIDVCSGGIIGLGESIYDRIILAFTLKELGVKSIPINIFNPIKNTPLGDTPLLSYEEILQTIAIFRFILPNKVIRFAGGRLLLDDYGRKGLKAGINGFITGNLLTTKGVEIDQDMQMLKECNYTVGLING